jgi:N-methylhydantoinase B/oxoprolinase/acetone carboxylase alpha subunit
VSGRAVPRTAPAGAPAGLDPVTFEVIRHRLWAINDDQARMGARLSGSPIIYESYDFNAALVTADGRGLYTGVYILHHGATIDHFVRRLLEERDEEDIREGDMFFTNDPWWGALHANDGILAMPVLWEGRIVAWSGIVMHDDDVGSPVPGSFVAGATDRFGEAPLFPAIRMCRGFEPVRDVERAYLRNSRTPEHNALNMRARVAALRTTHGRLEHLIRQYGVDAFLAAQEGILDHVERVVRARLREIPDGEWYAAGWLDYNGDGDAATICCRITKRRDDLTFDLAGTGEQVAAPVNCARPAMEAAVLGVILTYLCHDLPWATGALRRVARIVSREGTVNDARSPAAVSMASIMATLSTQDVVACAFSKMLLSSERWRDEAQGSWTPGISVMRIVTPDRNGEPAFARITDAFGGGGGARTTGDGIDSGGILHSMASRVSNAETVESRAAVLQLYRRELPDGGGAGRHRGGVAIEFAGMAHKAPPACPAMTRASGVAMPGGRGLSGGHPGAAAWNLIIRDSDVPEQFAAGRMPASAADIAGRREVQGCQAVTMAGPADVLVGVLGSGGGYGDALRRDPERVARDVRAGLVSAAMARSLYGVAVRDGAVDEEATRAARDAIRRARLAEGRPAGTLGGGHAAGGRVLHPVSDTVEAVAHDGRRSLRCALCGFRLGNYGDDHKRAALYRDLPLTAASPHNAGCSEDFVLREFCCPGCGAALAADVQRRDDEVLDESRFFTADGHGRPTADPHDIRDETAPARRLEVVP